VLCPDESRFLRAAGDDHPWEYSFCVANYRDRMTIASETANQIVKYLAQVPLENKSIIHNIALRLSNLWHFSHDMVGGLGYSGREISG
jgi:hypothetical protein